MDNTRAGGGWANALLWLLNNDLAARQARYFGPGLFSGSGNSNRLDAILIFIDTDILEEASFVKYVYDQKGIVVNTVTNPADRYAEIQRVLFAFCGFSSLAEANKKAHAIGAAVENTEVWCVASCSHGRRIEQPEVLSKAIALREFGVRLRSFDNLPFRRSLKNVERREKFCAEAAPNFTFILKSCPHFCKLVDQIASLVEK
ncbi:hypothetical protein [Paracoccus yeei]